MPIRLNNRFAPNGHKRSDVSRQIKMLPYSSDGHKPILEEENSTRPILALTSYSVLLGYIENGDFQEWLDKRHLATISANAEYPEQPFIELILRAVNMFPNPEALLTRVIGRLENIAKRNNVLSQKEREAAKCSHNAINAEIKKTSNSK